MSRERIPKEFRWWDEAGNPRVERTIRKGPISAAAVPNRLVDVQDSAGHWLGSVAQLTEGGPPLVVQAGPWVAPSWAWYSDGFDGTMVMDGELGLFGIRRDRIDMWCGRCRVELWLSAAQVGQVGRGRRGRVPCVVLRASDSGVV